MYILWTKNIKIWQNLFKIAQHLNFLECLVIFQHSWKFQNTIIYGILRFPGKFKNRETSKKI